VELICKKGACRCDVKGKMGVLWATLRWVCMLCQQACSGVERYNWCVKEGADKGSVTVPPPTLRSSVCMCRASITRGIEPGSINSQKA